MSETECAKSSFVLVSKDFKDAVGLACESAADRQVARQSGLAAGTARAIAQRYLERWTNNRTYFFAEPYCTTPIAIVFN